MVDSNVVDDMNIPKDIFNQNFTVLSCMSDKHEQFSHKASTEGKRTRVNYKRLMSDVCDMGKHLPEIKYRISKNLLIIRK